MNVNLTENKSGIVNALAGTQAPTALEASLRKYITEVIHNAFNQDCESRDVFRRGQEKI